MALLRSLYKCSTIRSLRLAAVSGNQVLNGSFAGKASRAFFSLSRPSSPSNSKRDSLDCKFSFCMGIGSARSFSANISAFPEIKDPEIDNVFKDYMACPWEELPVAIVYNAVNVLAKDTDDELGKQVLENVFRAAEAVEEFTGVLVSLRMELEDATGPFGQTVGPMSDEMKNALAVVYDRYMTYMASFGPEETYLKKKVENELGTRMMHIKMRCRRLGPKWGKFAVLATSGMSGSYIEQRA